MNTGKRKGNLLWTNLNRYVDRMILTLPKALSPAAHSGRENCSFRPRRDTLIISLSSLWNQTELDLNPSLIMQCVFLDKLLTTLSFNSFICYNGENNSYFIRFLKESGIKFPTQDIVDCVPPEAESLFSIWQYLLGNALGVIGREGSRIGQETLCYDEDPTADLADLMESSGADVAWQSCLITGRYGQDIYPMSVSQLIDIGWSGKDMTLVRGSLKQTQSPMGLTATSAAGQQILWRGIWVPHLYIPHTLCKSCLIYFPYICNPYKHFLLIEVLVSRKPPLWLTP